MTKPRKPRQPPKFDMREHVILSSAKQHIKRMIEVVGPPIRKVHVNSLLRMINAGLKQSVESVVNYDEILAKLPIEQQRGLQGGSVTCEVCKVEFPPAKEGHRFCGDKCRMKYHRAKRLLKQQSEVGQ